MNEELKDFNPDGVGVVGAGFFGLPCSVANSRVVLISAPWDVTVSYGDGTAQAPQALMEASAQLDLYDSSAVDCWREGIATMPVDEQIAAISEELRADAQFVIEALESGAGESLEVEAARSRVNKGSGVLNEFVYKQAKELLERGKIVGVVGGDHSTPYGAIKALGEVYDDFGILHIDAHRDLRVAYEGFEFSHASVMYNVLRDVEQVSKLVQVGVRDFCDAEQRFADQSEGRVVSFDDLSLARAEFEGEIWKTTCERIVAALPKKVYVSFDIDGLEIAYCPHTGTPVSGGLSYNKAVYLLEQIVASGRTIVGFDVVEVVPAEDDVTDLVVGARMVYKLCGLAIKSSM
ncbi:MAG: agmatinase family protein [Rikenellaceae bacterium]